VHAESVYHFHEAPVPNLPPIIFTVSVLPEHMLEEEDVTFVGGLDPVFTVSLAESLDVEPPALDTAHEYDPESFAEIAENLSILFVSPGIFTLFFRH
jgi:hypothetical protein